MVLARPRAPVLARPPQRPPGGPLGQDRARPRVPRAPRSAEPPHDLEPAPPRARRGTRARPTGTRSRAPTATPRGDPPPPRAARSERRRPRGPRAPRGATITPPPAPRAPRRGNASCPARTRSRRASTAGRRGGRAPPPSPPRPAATGTRSRARATSTARGGLRTPRTSRGSSESRGSGILLSRTNAEGRRRGLPGWRRARGGDVDDRRPSGRDRRATTASRRTDRAATPPRLRPPRSPPPRSDTRGSSGQGAIARMASRARARPPRGTTSPPARTSSGTIRAFAPRRRGSRGEVAEEGPQGVVVVGKQSRRGDVLHRAGERPARTDGNALGMDADARASDQICGARPSVVFLAVTNARGRPPRRKRTTGQ